MKFKINYEGGEIISVDKIYKGITEKGQKFEIHTNWNNDNIWVVDDIIFESKDFTNELKDEIANSFLQEING